MRTGSRFSWRRLEGKHAVIPFAQLDLGHELPTGNRRAGQFEDPKKHSLGGGIVGKGELEVVEALVVQLVLDDHEHLVEVGVVQHETVLADRPGAPQPNVVGMAVKAATLVTLRYAWEVVSGLEGDGSGEGDVQPDQ